MNTPHLTTWRRNMKGTVKPTIAAGLAAASMLALLAAPTFAAGPSATSPDRVHRGDTSGVYIWHVPGVDHGWHLETTDPVKTGAHEYTGTITTDGHFEDVHLVRPERDDSVTVDGTGAIQFDFKTYSGIDGIDFRDANGDRITFTLYEDGQLMPTGVVNLGNQDRHPDSNPFTLDRDPDVSTTAA